MRIKDGRSYSIGEKKTIGDYDGYNMRGQRHRDGERRMGEGVVLAFTKV